MSAASWLAATRLGVFHAGSFGALVAIALFGIIVYLMIAMARAGRPMRQIHPLPGLDALDEAIGRATEMGRPVIFLTGLGDVRDPQTTAMYPVLAHVARACARYDTRLIQPNYDPVVYAVNDAIVRESYLEAGRPDAYNPDDVRFLSDDQFAYAGGVWSIMQQEKPAAAIMYGNYFAEAITFVEVGALVGAVEIAATANISQLPFFMAGCDYTLIADEMYAASAYISKEPVLTGTIVGEDIFKFLMIACIIIGTVWASAAGKAALADWFKL